MDTKKQRQHRHDGTRLTESGNARSEQLLVVPTESLTNRQQLLGELLSGSERRRPGWFLEMKYQTCFLCGGMGYSEVVSVYVCEGYVMSVCVSVNVKGERQYLLDQECSNLTQTLLELSWFLQQGLSRVPVVIHLHTKLFPRHLLWFHFIHDTHSLHH